MSFFFPSFDDAFAGGDFGGCGLGFPPGGNCRANSSVVSLVEGIMFVMVAYKSVVGSCGVWGVPTTGLSSYQYSFTKKTRQSAEVRQQLINILLVNDTGRFKLLCLLSDRHLRSHWSTSILFSLAPIFLTCRVPVELSLWPHGMNRPRRANFA